MGMGSRDRLVEELRRMGIIEGVLYETVVTTYGDGYAPHASSMGTLFAPRGEGFSIRLRPHRGSRTYANLSEHREGVINVVRPELLVECALDLGILEITYEDAEVVNAPRLKEAGGWIEFRVEEMQVDGEWGVALCSPVVCRYRPSAPSPYTRAGSALVEASVHASRIPVFRALGDEVKVRELIEATEGCLRLAERLAPNTLLEVMAKKVREKFIASV